MKGVADKNDVWRTKGEEEGVGRMVCGRRGRKENQCGAVGEKKNALRGEARSKIPVQRACREGEGICFLLGCGWRGFGGAGV